MKRIALLIILLVMPLAFATEDTSDVMEGTITTAEPAPVDDPIMKCYEELKPDHPDAMDICKEKYASNGENIVLVSDHTTDSTTSSSSGSGSSVIMPSPTNVQKPASTDELIRECYERMKDETPDAWNLCKEKYATVSSSGSSSGGGHVVVSDVAHPTLIDSETGSSGGGNAVKPTVIQTVVIDECSANNKNLEMELKQVMEKYEYLIKEGNDEDLEQVKEHIHNIKQKLAYNNEKCVQKVVTVQAKEMNCNTVTEQLKNDLERLHEKLKTLKENNEDTTAIEKEISHLKEKIEYNRCDKSVENTEWIESTTKTSDVTEIYHEEMNKILTKADSIDDQITSLKELRTKIDTIIQDLIKKKESIEVDDFTGLVDGFKVKPNEIMAGDVKVDATNKDIVKKYLDKDVNVKATEDNVIMEVDDFEVTADEIEITDTIKVSNIELKVLPDKVKEKVKEKIKQAEIKKEEEKLVYNIRTQEERKLLGLFKITAEKSLKYDATTEDAELIGEEKPWWYGISSEVKN